MNKAENTVDVLDDNTRSTSADFWSSCVILKNLSMNAQALDH